MLYLFITLMSVIIVMGGLNAALIFLHYKEKRELFDRFMAKNFTEYNYLAREIPRREKAEEKNLKKMEQLKKKVSQADRLTMEEARKF